MPVAVTPSERRLFLTLPLAIVAVQLVWGGVDLLLATALDSVQRGTAVTTYGWIIGIASLFALVAHPAAGAASDRTGPQFGRRSVWVVVGSLGATLGLLSFGQAHTVPALGVTYVVAFAFLPVMLVPLYAAIPDRVGPTRRGAIGAIVGAATIVGGVAGNILAARFAGNIALGTAVFAAVLLAGAAVFALLGAESKELRPRPASSLASALREIRMIPHHHPDFTWFWLGRFALFLGYATITGLSYYILRDHIGESHPAEGVAVFAVVTGSTTLLASVVAGPWSDRARRRKPFLVVASVALGLGVLVPAVIPSFAAVMVAAAIIGLGFGVHLSVGTAVATLVLTSAETSGRDIGLLGLANAGAMVVAPFLGSYAAAAFGYPVLLVAAAAACGVAALAIVPIRSVR